MKECPKEGTIMKFKNKEEDVDRSFIIAADYETNGTKLGELVPNMFGFAASENGRLLNSYAGPIDEVDESLLFEYCSKLFDLTISMNMEIPVFFHNGIKFDNNLFLKRLPSNMFGFKVTKILYQHHLAFSRQFVLKRK